MTARQNFQQCIRERRQFRLGSLDWQYRTRAAIKYLAMVRGIPANVWGQL